MPTANKAAKAVFDSGKTSSYHINSLYSCQSGKSSSSAFRLVVHRDGGNKRYEFEAESPKLASAFFVAHGLSDDWLTDWLTDWDDRRDCPDYQESQDFVGTHWQRHWQIKAEQARVLIRSFRNPTIALLDRQVPSSSIRIIRLSMLCIKYP
jgi:SAPK-interacting protein 1 (Sin1), Pleckstrin-homology